MKKLLIWFAANVLNIIGGFVIGLSIINVFPLYITIVGITLVGVSYYYKFIYEDLINI